MCNLTLILDYVNNFMRYAYSFWDVSRVQEYSTARSELLRELRQGNLSRYLYRTAWYFFRKNQHMKHWFFLTEVPANQQRVQIYKPLNLQTEGVVCEFFNWYTFFYTVLSSSLLILFVAFEPNF